MKPIKTWILIADSNRAHMVENTGPGHGLRQLPDIGWSAPQQAGHKDDSGRSFNSVGSMRHKMEPNQRTGEHGEAFARAMFADLVRLKQRGGFDRLILCAPPAMLGHLRKQLPDQLKSDVTAEVAKDLTQIALARLPAHFSDVLAI
ncbi:MAG: host attachment protein [Alphaproteobacteria bacterium]|nr:host attachment protein [Alphaproteobacteria bacterium]